MVDSGPMLRGEMDNCGVYAIINMSDQHKYIGSSCDIFRRWWTHLDSLRKGNHHSIYLQRAFSKYGESIFQFKILLICEKKDLLYYEQKLLDIYNPDYNHSKRASGGSGPKTPEQRLKMSIAGTGVKHKPMSDIGRAHLSAAKKGYKHTPQSKAKLSIALKGRIISPETRAKISATLTGHTLSPESITKMKATKKANFEKRKAEQCQ